MSLRTKVIDAVLDDHIGQNNIVSRREVIDFFPNYSNSYAGVILSNSEMNRDHSPNYQSFTTRIGRGQNRIHQDILNMRQKERGE